jgi:hypothetical protein
MRCRCDKGTSSLLTFPVHPTYTPPFPGILYLRPELQAGAPDMPARFEAQTHDGGGAPGRGSTFFGR